MAKKGSTFYVCNNCGYETSSYSGKCFNCGEWNSLEEKIAIHTLKKPSARLTLNKISDTLNDDFKRLISNMVDVDNIFGGGIVPGSVILLAGQPGVGKST